MSERRVEVHALETVRKILTVEGLTITLVDRGARWTFVEGCIRIRVEWLTEGHIRSRGGGVDSRAIEHVHGLYPWVRVRRRMETLCDLQPVHRIEAPLHIILVDAIAHLGRQCAIEG